MSRKGRRTPRLQWQYNVPRGWGELDNGELLAEAEADLIAIVRQRAGKKLIDWLVLRYYAVPEQEIKMP